MDNFEDLISYQYFYCSHLTQKTWHYFDAFMKHLDALVERGDQIRPTKMLGKNPINFSIKKSM